MQYIQIKEAIAEQISCGMLVAKQKLPAERQLAQSFATTRVTLREALSLLEAEGIIYREDRRGWFISPKRFVFNPMKNVSFHNDAEQQRRALKIKLMKAQTILANKEATTLLSLPPFSNIYQIDRVYYLDDSPAAFARHYILPTQFPDLLKQDLTNSITEIYDKIYHINGQKKQYKIYTSSFVKEIAQALRATDGTPTSVIERSNYNEQNKPFDCCIEYWRHNAISIEFNS